MRLRSLGSPSARSARSAGLRYTDPFHPGRVNLPNRVLNILEYQHTRVPSCITIVQTSQRDVLVKNDQSCASTQTDLNRLHAGPARAVELCGATRRYLPRRRPQSTQPGQPRVAYPIIKRLLIHTPIVMKPTNPFSSHEIL